jgi:hypothetical protein
VGFVGVKTLRSLAAAIFAVGSLPVACLALEDPTKPKLCEPGHKMARQTPPGYDFSTTSWMRPFQNAFAYSACIQNNKPGYELFVNWHIPEVVANIVPFDSSFKPRVFSVHNTADVNGCLIYGNTREVMKVQFIGHHDDLVESGKEGDCADLRAQQSASLVQSDAFPDFMVDGRMTIPSNHADVANTLIRFVYEIGLRQDNHTYAMVFNYAAAPATADSFKGSINDLTIRPSSDVVNGAWEKVGLSGPLKDLEGHFTIPLSLPKQYSLTQQEYVIYDKEGAAVGRIPAPFLAIDKQ